MSSTPPSGGMPRSKPEGPRRVRNGIRLRRKEDAGPRPWPASAWADRLGVDEDETLLAEAKECGRTGQTAKFELGSGFVEAVIQGVEAKPHTVRIEFPSLNDTAWTRVLQNAAGGAIYAAKLLAGEFPEIVAEPFEAAGHPLIPAREEIRITSTYGAKKRTWHEVLACLVLLERLEDFPELTLEMRGRNAETFRNHLQEARMLSTQGVSQAHTNPDIVRLASPVGSIENRVGEFWRPGFALAEARSAPLPEHVPQALLRRLGPSPLEGRFPITGLLASIYDTIAEDAARSISGAVAKDLEEDSSIDEDAG